jgi:hypothetical protein
MCDFSGTPWVADGSSERLTSVHLALPPCLRRLWALTLLISVGVVTELFPFQNLRQPPGFTFTRVWLYSKRVFAENYFQLTIKITRSRGKAITHNAVHLNLIVWTLFLWLLSECWRENHPSVVYLSIRLAQSYFRYPKGKSFLSNKSSPIRRFVC